MSKQYYFKQFSLAYVCRLNIKTVLFQTIQFRIRTLFSSNWLIGRTLSSGSDGNEGVLRINQSSSITATAPSDCLVPYPGHLFGEGVLPLCRDTVGAFYSPNWLGKVGGEVTVVVRGNNIKRKVKTYKHKVNMVGHHFTRQILAVCCVIVTEIFERPGSTLKMSTRHFHTLKVRW